MYSNHPNVDGFTDTLLAKAMTLAKTPKDWSCIWDAVDNVDDEEEKKVLEALKAITTWTKAEWEELNGMADSESALESVVYIKLLDFYTDAPSIVRFYLDCEDESGREDDVMQAIRDKLFSLTTREEAKLIEMLSDDEDLREAAE